MPRKKPTLVNPFLNEYVYSCLKNVSHEQRSKLSNATLRILSSSTKARNFCINSSEAEKKRVLTELGFTWGMIIMPSNVNTVNELKKLLVKAEEGRTAAGMEHLVKEKIFITTDKQTQYILGLAAQTIAHSNYFLNLDLIRTGQILRNWKKKISDGKSEEMQEAEQFASLIDKAFLNAFMLYHHSEGFLGVRENEFLILQYMCDQRHLYMTKERLQDHFTGVLTTRMVTSALKRLDSGMYIRKNFGTKIIKYTITGSGIELVCRFRNRVLSNL